MKSSRLLRFFLGLCAFVLFTSTTYADISRRADVQTFINRMNAKYRYPVQDLQLIFQNIRLNFDVLALMSKPAEKKPWYVYRKIMITPLRLEEGVRFWREHERTLRIAEQRYGVPAKIIVGIIGVETTYGKNVGNFKVAEALATLAFEGESRNEFFLNELEHFLILAREQGWNPLQPVGSYAGAMGIPQFMPSNIRRFGVTLDKGHYINLIKDADTAIMSVANYLNKHGWKPNHLIVARAKINSDSIPSWEKQRPNLSLHDLRRWNIVPENHIQLPLFTQAGLLALEGEDSPEYWLAFNNFYVITRYNKSPLYAMAVWQLGTRIKTEYDSRYRSDFRDR